MAGTLFVVGTPIGNLEDITLRALRTLREVDLVAAEDTRRTSKLLAHYEIRRPLTSLHEHNEVSESPRLVARLLAGESVALVSDAGTPGISDPGSRLVRAARDAGAAVVPVPGPSAVATALSVSGLPAETHLFLGFPPSSGTAREEWFERASAEPGVVVAFESPHRVRRTLEDFRIHSPRSPILVFRELTKLNESFIKCPSADHDCSSIVREQGEFTLVIGPQTQTAAHQPSDEEIAVMVGRMTEMAHFGLDESFTIVSRHLGVPIRVVRKAVKKTRIAAKQREGSSP